MTQSQLPTTPNLSTRLRRLTEGWLTQIGALLHRWGVSPDLLTLLGLGFMVLAAILVARGALAHAAVALVVGMPLDVLDGAVARAMQRNSSFGGVLDSVVDRYGDLFVLLALAYYLATRGAFIEMLLVFATVVGSTQVSYIRARAGAAGIPCAGGLFSRFERSVLLVLTLLTGWLIPGLLILAVGSNLTALHRLWSVYRFSQTKGL